MGSDSMKKSYYKTQKIRPFIIVVTTTIISFLFIIAFNFDLQHKYAHQNGSYNDKQLRRNLDSLPIFSEKQTLSISDTERTLAKASIPKQCHSTLDKVIQCQQNQNKKKQTIVFACHRKWCNSLYGHCEKVNGIGDRTKHMLSLFSDALDKCLRVELDYPQIQNGIQLRFNDFEYIDSWGYIAELFHFRSYDVSDLKVNVSEWGKESDGDRKGNSKTFVHFIPSHDQYQFHKYDPCLYHVLFKTTNILDTEIHYYSDLIGFEDNNVIGMHFRTGDLTAFGLDNKDIRTHSDSLIQSYDKMMTCALDHARKLGIQPSPTDGRIKLFLATDNQIIKDKAKTDSRFSIYISNSKPTAYIRSEGDRSAYTDLYLLSKTRGLVVNELPNKYDGPAEKVSTFAQLAMNIGFMNDHQLYKCKLED